MVRMVTSLTIRITSYNVCYTKLLRIGRNSDTFKLWYDFSIPAIGEIRRGEIGGYGMHPQSAVKEIGYVVDNNGVRRRYWVNSNVWVEGLGCLHNGAGNPGFSRFSNNVAFAVKGIPVYVDSRLGIDGRNSSSSCSSLTFNIVDNILSYTTKPMGYASPSGTDCTRITSYNVCYTKLLRPQTYAAPILRRQR